MATTVHGIAIRPGVSRNRRRYTTEALGRSYDRLQTRLEETVGRPVTMRTFHPHPSGTSATVTSIVGHLTKVSQLPDGAIAYEAVLADTPEAKTAAALVKPGPDGRQHLASVSIRGWWVGETRTDGDGCETGDDLEIDGLDLTDTPGVSGATVTAGPATETAENGRPLIFESVEEAFIDMTETSQLACVFEDGLCIACAVTEAAKALTPGSDYADPGYQADKKRRYPCDTAAHCRAAWAYINKAENQKPYTAAQLKRIKQRIRSAAKKLGVDIANESVEASVTHLVESYAAILPEAARPKFLEEAYACVRVGNGPADINVSAYGNDPADLQAVIGRLSAAVVAALDAVDPDGDGDIDLPGDKDGGAGWRESAPTAGTNESAPAANTNKEGHMTTETKPAEGTEATTPVTNESIAAAVTTAMTSALEPLTETLAKLAPAVSAEQAKAAVDGKPADETAGEQKAADEAAGLDPKIIEAITAKVRNDLLNESRNGTHAPERKGLVAKVTEENFDLSQLSESERGELVGQALLQRLYPAVAATLGD